MLETVEIAWKEEIQHGFLRFLFYRVLFRTRHELQSRFNSYIQTKVSTILVCSELINPSISVRLINLKTTMTITGATKNYLNPLSANHTNGQTHLIRRSLADELFKCA